jgi:ferredoxin-NADP reductase
MAMVKKYRTIVSAIEHSLPDVYTLTLTLQDGKFRYKPGQFLHLTLDEYDPSQQWPESRCFSIQTNPDEEYLKITFSVKGLYTKRMAQELAVGKFVWVKLPYGELFSTTMPERQNIFIAGGTGVTPYLSLFTHRCFVQYKSPVLYFGARSEQYNIYKKEFEQAQSINSTFQIHTYYEDIAGLLDIKNILQRHNGQCIFYLSGPPVMIKNLKNYLTSKSVPEGNIKTDEWE